MRLFLYGTLLNPAVLAARSGDPLLPKQARPAVLRGWRRVTLAGTRWPTLRRYGDSVVPGKAVTVGARSLQRLSAYQGPAYRLRRVVLQPRIPAWTWIAPRGTQHPWRSSHDQL
jgi:hypothetical protein